MIRSAALLVVIALGLGSMHLLVCELACVEAPPEHHAAACHETESPTTLVNGAGHGCDHDATAPAIAVQTAKFSQQSGALLGELLDRIPLYLAAAPARFFELPPGASGSPRAPRVTVLRI